MLGDGISFSLMVGMGETYLPAFVLALGMGQVASGLIGTIPLLIGAILQLVSPLAVRRLGSHRRWVVACSLCQAACFVPLCAAAWIGSIPDWGVVRGGLDLLGIRAGNQSGLEHLGRHDRADAARARYFARRTRFSQFGVCGRFHHRRRRACNTAHRAGRLLDVFGFVFLAAGLCRLVSAGFIFSQSEPVPPGDDHRQVSLGEFIWRIHVSGEGRVLVYLLTVQTAAQICGPYFTPYMLGPLGAFLRPICRVGRHGFWRQGRFAAGHGHAGPSLRRTATARLGRHGHHSAVELLDRLREFLLPDGRPGGRRT